MDAEENRRIEILHHTGKWITPPPKWSVYIQSDGRLRTETYPGGGDKVTYYMEPDEWRWLYKPANAPHW